MTHRDIEYALPFYVNGTLDEAAIAEIERELASCASCAAEIDQIRALRSVLVDIDESAAAGAAAAAFNDTMRRIDEWPAGDASDVARVPVMRRIREAVVASWRDGRVRVAATAMTALLVVLSVVALRTTVADRDGVPAITEGEAASDVVAPAPAPAARLQQRETLAPPAAAAPAVDEKKSADAASQHARQLARNGSIGLLVADVPAAIANAQRIADANFGVVTGLQDDAPSAPGAEHTARLTLSVPDDRFSHAVASLAQLGGITARSVTTEDLTDSIVDSTARLRNLRREEADLLQIMDRSGKVADILEVEQQLASTRDEIERLDAQTQSMQHRVAYATIDVNFSDEKTTAVASPSAGAQIATSWQNAEQHVSSFTLALIAQLLLVAAFLPYLIVLAVALLAIRMVVIRRRK